jgi:hypothetical protein
VITENVTFKPEKTGTYKVICVGAGSNGRYIGSTLCGGSGGGVAIKTIRLVSTTTYNVTVNDGNASFSNILSATTGTIATQTGGVINHSAGGTASGGDYNFTGLKGSENSGGKNKNSRGGSVGVTIADLSRWYSYTAPNGMNHVDGDCLLKYGGGGGVSWGSDTSTAGVFESNGYGAAVIIVPLEMEE